MLVSAIHFAALQRAELAPEQHIPFYLYIDEMHSFVSLSFADMLSEARKYGLALFLTHQYLDQLQEPVRSAIFGNIGTLISFRVGTEDALYLSKEFYPVFSQSDFVNLPPYSMYIKLMIEGLTSKPFSAKSFAPSSNIAGYKEEIVKRSRDMYIQNQYRETLMILITTVIKKTIRYFELGMLSTISLMYIISIF